MGSFPLASETLETLSKVAQHIFLEAMMVLAVEFIVLQVQGQNPNEKDWRMEN